MIQNLGRITGLHHHPGRHDRVLIERNGKPWIMLSLERLAELSVQLGEELSEDRVREIEEMALLDQGIEKALRLLKVRARSEAELVRRLEREGLPPRVVSQVIERLRALGYVDDRVFAVLWIAQRQASKPRGRAGLRAELRAKGIDPDIIEDLLPRDQETELAAARRVVEKFWPRLQKLDRRIAQRRLIGLLERRGFSWEVIRTVLKDLAGGEETARYHDTD